jgi:hypothetical protein
VNDKPLDENVAALQKEIAAYRGECAHWWRFNQRIKILLIVLSVVASLGATISGVLLHPKTAAIFAACGAAVITFQGSFKTAEEAYKYGKALTECDRLTQKLSFQTKSPADFDGVLEAYHQLRAIEGNRDAQTRLQRG